MRASDLDFCSETGFRIKRLRIMDKSSGCFAPGEPVISADAEFSLLFRPDSGIKIAEERHSFRDTGGQLGEKRRFRCGEGEVKPGYELRGRRGGFHSPVHRVDRSEEDFLRLLSRAARTAARMFPVNSAGGKTCRIPFAEGNVDDASQTGYAAEDFPGAFIQIALSGFCRRTDAETSGECHGPCQLRIFLEKCAVRRLGDRFDHEQPGPDAVAQTFVNGPFELCKPGIPIVSADQACEVDGQPESVDPFAGKAVQIRVRIVIRPVRKFVPVARRAFDGTEETA